MGRECHHQGQTRKTLFTRVGWRGSWRMRRGGEKKKKRQIQGETLLSLTTKMEIRQGQTVRDHLTVNRLPLCVANTSPASNIR